MVSQIRFLNEEAPRSMNLKNVSQHFLKVFHDGGPYHIETSPLICIANQWTCFYMIGPPPWKIIKIKIIKTNLTKIFY